MVRLALSVPPVLACLHRDSKLYSKDIEKEAQIYFVTRQERSEAQIVLKFDTALSASSDIHGSDLMWSGNQFNLRRRSLRDGGVAQGGQHLAVHRNTLVCLGPGTGEAGRVSRHSRAFPLGFLALGAARATL